jgi:hypothetical protein
MKQLEIPMWVNEEKLLLKALLERLDVPAGLSWTLYLFDGVTDPSCSMHALELMDRIEASGKVGVPLARSQFESFSEGIRDINDIHIIGKMAGYSIDLSAEDSGSWTIKIDDDLQGTDGSL